MITKIPIVTQNFSSPDALSDTPLMLLPQPLSLNALPDRDQEGFSQLLLHDLHRHRQSFVRSYTAFETLKKRQDFVLRQENLRALQNLEQRVTTKQEHTIDQSVHSYEQCFVKVINGNSSMHNMSSHQETVKSGRSTSAAFEKYHLHQLSHTTAMPLDPPPIIPFHRYQKSHRPRATAKYRTHPSIQRTAQCYHDAFQSSGYFQQSQPFQSFTESYLQRFADRSTNRISLNDTQEQDENELSPKDLNRRIFSATERKPPTNLLDRPKTTETNRHRSAVSSRTTNTPSSTPQMTYHDAVKDGLTLQKTNDKSSSMKERRSSVNEQRRSSQQSSEKSSFTLKHSNSTKRPKSSKKKELNRSDSETPSKTDIVTGVSSEGDILKQAMFVQNYGNNTPDSMGSSKNERVSTFTIPKTAPIKKTASVVSRSSAQANDLNQSAMAALHYVEKPMPTTGLDKKIEFIRSSPSIDSRNSQTPTIPEVAPTLPQTSQSPIPITTEATTATTTTSTNATTTTPTVTENATKTESTNLLTKPSRVDSIDPRTQLKKPTIESIESLKDMISFELDIPSRYRSSMKKTRFDSSGKNLSNNLNEDETHRSRENQATFDLLEKIRNSTAPLLIGQHPISQKNCRFELPFDLKHLETLTPLDYLTKYCRLSTRRNYQFKRIFEKYRNNQYRLESNFLLKSIQDVHSESFTKTHYERLCQLINTENQQHQFTFETFAAVLALSERILCDSDQFRRAVEEFDLGKDTIEKCDFDSLDRKIDGLNVSETLKTLLRAL